MPGHSPPTMKTRIIGSITVEPYVMAAGGTAVVIMQYPTVGIRMGLWLSVWVVHPTTRVGIPYKKNVSTVLDDRSNWLHSQIILCRNQFYKTPIGNRISQKFENCIIAGKGLC